jgi:hypothetical protein
MRAMGPGSVSSLLKIALDVVYVALWGIIGALAMAAIAALLVPIDKTFTLTVAGASREIHFTKASLAGSLAAIGGYFGIILYVVGQLRRVFATLTAGDPFHPANIRRMQLIGLGLAGLAIGNVLIRNALAMLNPGLNLPGGGWVDMPTWFSVLVVFVLAEVFREGARLRREAELTI